MAYQRLKRKGQAILLVALLLGFLVSLAGLSVDLVFAYAVRHYLGIAIDSVALSGMRGLSSGSTFTEQADSINRIANLMLESNFPDGYLLSSNVRFSSPPTIYGPTIPADAPPTFVQDTNLALGIRELRVTGEVVVPTFFARAFGLKDLTVRSSAVTSRQDTNVMLVLDRSRSLFNANAWDDVQQAATTFLDFFDNNGDRLGLVSFGTGANVDVSLRSGFKDGSYAASQIEKMESQGGTNSPLGLWLAYGELLRINDPNSLNVIVFFTDGQPTAMPNRWNVHTWGNKRNGSSSSPYCNSGQKDAVIQTYGGPTNMLGFNKWIAGPPEVEGKYPWGADFDIEPGCSNLATPYVDNVELLLNNSICLPSQWSAEYDDDHGCEDCTGGESYTRTFDIVPGPYGGYNPCSSSMFSTSSSGANARGARWMESARNLTADIAAKANADTSIGAVTIYSLGLGVAGLTENEDLLLRVANDKDSSAFDNTRPEGEYIFAPDVDDLAKAFDKVRGNVIRLTR